MVRLSVSLQGMNVSQCNVLRSDGNKKMSGGESRGSLAALHSVMFSL